MKLSRRPLTIFVAVVATVVVYLMGTSLGAAFKVPAQLGNMDETRALTIGVVVAITTILGFLAWALATVLERATKNARGVWTVVALFLTLGSLPAVFQLGLEGSAVFWQILLHVVFGGLLIAGFWPTFGSALGSQPSTEF
jgi:predicted permease